MADKFSAITYAAAKKMAADSLKGAGAIKGQKGDKGEKGDTGAQGAQGAQGAKGDPGFSPTITAQRVSGGVVLNITDANGTRTAELYDGAKGDTGATGAKGEKGDKGDKGDPGSGDATDLSGYYTAEQVDEKLAQFSPTKTYSKYVVVGVWGQSNAVGFDESPLTPYDTPKDPARIFQYSTALKPLSYCAESLQNPTIPGARGAVANDMRNERAGEPEERLTHLLTKGIHLPLANLMLDVIPDDYAVIIVPAAYGGLNVDNFMKGASASGQNGAGNGRYVQYDEFIKRMTGAMESGADKDKNILAGIVWSQGENQAGSMDGATYVTKLKQIISDANNDLSKYAKRTTRGTLTENDWYFFEWPKYFKDRDTRGILTALREYFGTRYADIPIDTPVNTTTYVSSTPESHYGKNSFRMVIAPRVFSKMKNNSAFLMSGYSESTDTSALESKISDLEAKVKRLESGGTVEAAEWHVPVDGTDFEWCAPNSKMQSTYSNGNFHAQGSGGSGILFNDKVTKIKFTVPQNTGNPPQVIITYDPATGGHNNVYVGGDYMWQYGQVYKARNLAESFYNLPVRNYNEPTTEVPFCKMLATANVRDTEILLEKIGDTTVRATIGNDSSDFDVSQHISTYVANSTIRFGFPSYWSSQLSYDVTGIQVYS